MFIQSSTPVSSGHLRPITQAELTQLLDNYNESFNKELWPKIEGTVQKLVELKKEKQFLDKEQATLAKEQATLAKEQAALAKEKEEAIKGIALARNMKASAQAKLDEVARERQVILTKQFYSMFNKTPIPTENINALFQKYLAEGSLTVEKSKEGKSFPQINTMNSVTQYLSDHPEIKMCDFRVFKTAVYDIPTLANFLAKSTVRAIALSNAISAEAKSSLANAVAARNGSLKVQYFD